MMPQPKRVRVFSRTPTNGVAVDKVIYEGPERRKVSTQNVWSGRRSASGWRKMKLSDVERYLPEAAKQQAEKSAKQINEIVEKLKSRHGTNTSKITGELIRRVGQSNVAKDGDIFVGIYVGKGGAVLANSAPMFFSIVYNPFINKFFFQTTRRRNGFHTEEIHHAHEG